MDWTAFKDFAATLAISKDALHIYAAFLIQVAAASLLRRPLSSWLPWLCVLAAELVNEGLDLWYGNEGLGIAWVMAGTRHDILNTMLLPTVLLLLCRYANPLFRRPARPEPASDPKPDPEL